MTERYDLIVVGAGPGGSATAYYASKAGLRTLVLDRQEFPRDKPCGDGLMPHAASEVSLMGLGDWLDEPHHGRFTGFSVYTRTAYLRQGVPPLCTDPTATSSSARRPTPSSWSARSLREPSSARRPGPPSCSAPRRER